MSIFSKLSIRAVLGLIITVLGVLLVALSANALIQAIERSRAVDKIATRAPVSQVLFKMLQDTRLERGDTLIGLKADGTVDTSRENDITREREASEAGYRASLERLAGLDLPALPALVARLRSTHDAVEGLRPRSATALHQAKPAREPGLVQDWPTVTQAYLDAIEATGDRLESSLKLVDPEIDQLLAIKRSAWTVRNFSGAITLRISGAMSAGQGWSPAEAFANAEDRGRVLGAWAIVTEVAARPEIPAAVADGVTRANAYFDGAVAAERNDAAQALATGQKPAIAVQTFLDHQLALLNQIHGAASMALSAIVERADRQRGDALRGLVLDGLMLLAALSLTVVGFVIVQRRVSSPIRALTASMRRLADHDLAAEIPGSERGDEIGAMSRAVAVFKDSMIEADRLSAEQRAEQARKEQRQQAIERHIKSFDGSVAESLHALATASTELQATSRSMSETAEETSRQSTAVAAASEQASVNVQTVASAAEELSSSIAEIGRQVSESTRISGQAVEQADRTNSQVQSLAEGAQRIGAVVKLINDIAGQTNLLALNATIEAARAGEAGKGFAVVASEVKNLATQTAKATGDITAQIDAIQSATGGAVQAIHAIGETIGRVNEIAIAIASAVEEQGAATQEIARNVQQASAGTAEVSANIVGVTQAASLTGAASSQVLGSAGALATLSESLRGEIDGFISEMRSA